ncbi:lycopene cyclase family protein [Amycolatopsis sp. CA-230715]|uniref:lycopene cyclase family protein n=1 Tax=Amycolatopsis sp. CA-230715 TaxID=2745196 RepID=UPI001C010BDB|nr:lycopene cyclase family protein [Amycolatopsis sp. CA-230715]
MVDVLVAGAGPAGWSVAAACAREGLHTALVDPAPSRPWTATYALWRDELPSLPDSAIAAAPATTVAFGRTRHVLDREYLVLDNTGLRHWVTDERVELRQGKLDSTVHGGHGSTAVLADGSRVAAAIVVDARGSRRRAGARTEQTAYGVTLSTAEAAAVTGGATALFMDWRNSPTFLYSVPLGHDRVLVEETSLARKPGLPLGVLADRLRARLARAGVTEPRRRERVRIALDTPPSLRGSTLGFGAAGGFVHPATGYSVATSLALAPAVAAALADGLPAGPSRALRAARHAVWPASALAVHQLRRKGLHAVRSMPDDALPAFFDLFFALPTELHRAYTSGRTDISGTASAMAHLFRTAPWRLRTRLAL